MVSGNIEKFTLPPMDRRREFLKNLLSGSKAEKPPPPFSGMFLLDEDDPKKRDSRFDMEKMTEDDKIRKNMNGIGGKLSRNDLIQIEDVGEEEVKRESESRSKELFIDDDIAIERTNDPIFFIGRHQPIRTRDMIIPP